MTKTPILTYYIVVYIVSGDIMAKQLIHVGSITIAMKAKDLLRSAGLKAYIERTKRLSERVGCGYSVYVVNGSTVHAENILREAGINILGRSAGAGR